VDGAPETDVDVDRANDRGKRSVSTKPTMGFHLRRRGKTMHMSSESILVIIVVGIIAGWLAGLIVQGTGLGIIGDLIIGIVGAFIGDWVLPRVGIHLGTGIVSAIINATIGAIILLLQCSFSSGGGRRY
jgi:uncharacterized membrane protein YeaQ/YmgE (transglycosylase-associated protein family)